MCVRKVKLYEKTYGFRKIIRIVASEPRCKRVPKASRTCSFAAVCSSDVGCKPVPSSSTLNRYRKHLSLNGCSLFTVVVFFRGICRDFIHFHSIPSQVKSISKTKQTGNWMVWLLLLVFFLFSKDTIIKKGKKANLLYRHQKKPIYLKLDHLFL